MRDLSPAPRPRPEVIGDGPIARLVRRNLNGLMAAWELRDRDNDLVIVFDLERARTRFMAEMVVGEEAVARALEDPQPPALVKTVDLSLLARLSGERHCLTLIEEARKASRLRGEGHAVIPVLVVSGPPENWTAVGLWTDRPTTYHEH